MVEPTRAQKDLLDPFELMAYNLADFWNKHMRWQAALYNSTVMVGFTLLAVARRVQVSGLEHAQGLDYDRGVMILANHRTYYDYFTIMSVMARKVEKLKVERIMFPVRSAFFYERPLGVAVNMAMSGMAMFPPIMRDRAKKLWNEYAVARCVDELEENATVLGFHPEGRRHAELGAFKVGRGKLGIARIALEAENAQVMPVFLTGITDDLLEEIRRNWMEPERYPVFLAFGPHVALDDLRGGANTPEIDRQAVSRCMDAITELAEVCRKMAGFSDRETAEA